MALAWASASPSASSYNLRGSGGGGGGGSACDALTGIASTLAFCLETSPAFRSRSSDCRDLLAVGGWEQLTVEDCEPKPLPIFYLFETVCIAIFSVEYFFRIITVHAAIEGEARARDDIVLLVTARADVTAENSSEGSGNNEDRVLRIQGPSGVRVPEQPVALPELGALRAVGQLPGTLPRYSGALLYGASVQQVGDG